MSALEARLLPSWRAHQHAAPSANSAAPASRPIAAAGCISEGPNTRVMTIAGATRRTTPAPISNSAVTTKRCVGVKALRLDVLTSRGNSLIESPRERTMPGVSDDHRRRLDPLVLAKPLLTLSKVLLQCGTPAWFIFINAPRTDRMNSTNATAGANSEPVLPDLKWLLKLGTL